MGEINETIQFADLKPGDKIYLSEVTELPGFEDRLIDSLYPDWEMASSRVLWEGRTRLQNLITPQRHFGRIIDVSLELMPEPFERLMDARERGIKFTEKGGLPFKKLSDETRDLFRENTVGFVFGGDAVVSGIGQAASIYAELWYTPSYMSPKRGAATSPIKRIISKPETDQDQIDEIISSSIGRSFALSREGLRRHNSRTKDKYQPKRQVI